MKSNTNTNTNTVRRSYRNSRLFDKPALNLIGATDKDEPEWDGSFHDEIRVRRDARRRAVVGVTPLLLAFEEVGL